MWAKVRDKFGNLSTHGSRTMTMSYLCPIQNFPPPGGVKLPKCLYTHNEEFPPRKKKYMQLFKNWIRGFIPMLFVKYMPIIYVEILIG